MELSNLLKSDIVCKFLPILDDLERAMLTINPNLVSKLTDEDRSMCRVDLSLKCTKLAMEAAKKEAENDEEGGELN
jgi:hypothetical protein